MVYSFLDTGLASIDIILLFVIALLEVLYYYFKKKYKSVNVLKYIIPTLIIGLVIFLTIKGVVQDYFFIVSVAIISVFYIYVHQIDYKMADKTPKKNYKKSKVEDDFSFKSSVEEDEINNFKDFEHEKTKEKSEIENFEALIGKIYKEQKKREN